MFRDAQDEMLAELKAIRAELSDDVAPDTSPQSLSVDTGAKSTPFIIVDSADENNANPDGTISVDPGKKTSLTFHRRNGDDDKRMSLLAVSMSDNPWISYEYEIDYNIKFSTRNALGTFAQPFSFEKELGRVYPAQKSLSIIAVCDSEAPESQDVAARMFIGGDF